MNVLSRRSFAIVTGACSLAACSASLLPKPPTPAARYTLDDGGAGGDRVGGSALKPALGAPVLLVAEPTTAPGFDTAQMLYLQVPQRLESFAFHEWVEPPARMLVPPLVRALQATGVFRAVLASPTAAIGDHRLEVELVRLQQDFTTRPSRVRLTLRAVLVDTKTRQVMAAQSFDDTDAALGDDPVAGAAAAQRVTRRVLAVLAAACGVWALRP